MNRFIGAGVTCFALAANAQQVPITTRSALVLVPALVRDRPGNPVFTLQASDFTLTDDGVVQPLHLEEDTGGEPLALVIDLEVGGAGTREFSKLKALVPMLESLIGNVPHTIAVVGFDSEPALVQPFTSSLDSAASAILTLTPDCSREQHQESCAAPNAVHDESLGDNGAAILDSLVFSVNLLRKRPPNYRPAILLISETLDRGSHIGIEEAARAITDTNTTIYSVGFPTARSDAAHYAYRELPTQPAGDSKQAVGNPLQPGGFTFFALANHTPNPPAGCMGKDPDPDPEKSSTRLSQAYDCAGQLLPPLLFARTAAIYAWDGLQKNVPETVAHLTGGEYFKLTTAKSLEQSLQTISNHLPNRYILSFQPKDPHPGIHQLTLRLNDRPDLSIEARRSYWAQE